MSCRAERSISVIVKILQFDMLTASTPLRSVQNDIGVVYIAIGKKTKKSQYLKIYCDYLCKKNNLLKITYLKYK